MRKKIVCSTLAMALAASMLFGCASESKTETTAAAGETTAAAETTAEAAKEETNGEKLKVTLLVTGSFGDKAFNDSAQAGMKKLEEELGDKVEVNMVEMGSDKTKFEGSMLDDGKRGSGRTGAQRGGDSSDFGRIPCLTKSDLIK